MGTKISELNDASTPFGNTDYFPVVQSGATKKGTFQSVSRKVMTTAAGAAGDSGYYAKIATISVDSTVNVTYTKNLLIQGVQGAYIGAGLFNISIRQASSGLDSGSYVRAMYIDDDRGAITHDSLRLIQTTAANGNDIEVWIKKSASYSSFVIYELGKGKDAAYSEPVYNNNAPWQASDPASGAEVEIVSEWKNSGTWVPAIVGETTAGVGTYSNQIGYYYLHNGFVTLTGRITWSAHTGTGNMAISNLPYSIASGAQSAAQIMHSSITGSGDAAIFALGGQSTLPLFKVALGSAWAQIAIDTAADIAFSITYKV